MKVWEPVIRQIVDPAVRELALRGRVRSFAGGSRLIAEGERGDAVYVLLAGKAKVFVSDTRGREVVLRHLGPGEIFGEMSLDGLHRSASVQTMEASVCSLIGREELLRAIGRDPQIALSLLAMVSARARDATLRLKDLALMDVYGRFVRLLQALDTETGDDGLAWTRERLTHQEIASRVGASRDMISRIVKTLRVGGYVEVRERRFTILRALPARW